MTENLRAPGQIEHRGWYNLGGGYRGRQAYYIQWTYHQHSPDHEGVHKNYALAFEVEDWFWRQRGYTADRAQQEFVQHLNHLWDIGRLGVSADP